VSPDPSPFRQAPLEPRVPFSRRLVVLAVLVLAMAAGLLWRALDLQLKEHGFLAHQGELRTLRVAVQPAHRGQISDRHGEPLAVSTVLPPLSQDGRPVSVLARLRGPGHEQELLAFARGLPPPDTAVSGAPRRYYPAGEVTGHLLGFTSGEDVGQEGLERAYDAWLGGQSGLMRVRQDARGHIVEQLGEIRPARDGRDLTLSIDLTLQRLADQALARARAEHGASAGSVVVLDVTTGEVLALVSQPSYDPNMRDVLAGAVHRNHAAADLIEPGSTVKPFLVAAGLADGRYSPASTIDTSPGFVLVGRVREQDEHNLGVIDLPTVLARSSNVGMARLALSLPPRQIWQTLSALGFGQTAGSGLPGEPAGRLSAYGQWSPVSIATLSHGYGLSVTPLALAHAYATLGAFGVARPLSLLRAAAPPAGRRVLSARVCGELLTMLESVVAAEGATGRLAAIPGYRVAGKTGTVEKLHDGRYDGQRYTALFAGVAPARRPRLATVVVVDGVPADGPHQGGAVAAPVFSQVMGAALGLAGVPPDDPDATAGVAPLLTARR
jgi:cell division protein FtsI (penicillin-binding protein 3)